MRRDARSSGFTLVELLVVMALIALLLGLLLPVLGRAKENARTAQCLSNLRQLSAAALIYCDGNRGSYPVSQYMAVHAPVIITYGWDFTITRDTSTGQRKVTTGLLFNGRGEVRIQQCPSFDGKSNTPFDPYTGYNYNTSYIGGEQAGMGIIAPARASQVSRPARCALFGDGQYGAGANKFMRSPFPSPTEIPVARYAGTQGFRHSGRSNAAFADGHAETIGARHTKTVAGAAAQIAPGTGFLSEDNSLYSLK